MVYGKDFVELSSFINENNLYTSDVVTVYNKWIIHSHKNYTGDDAKQILEYIKDIFQTNRVLLNNAIAIDLKNIKLFEGTA